MSVRSCIVGLARKFGILLDVVRRRVLEGYRRVESYFQL